MKATTWSFTLSALILSAVVIGSAQEKVLPQLRQYTAEQRWTRLAEILNYTAIATIAYAKSLNHTSDDVAQFFVKLYAPTWGKPNSGNPMSVFRGMRYNWGSIPTVKFELLDSLENKVTGRYSRWHTPLYKDSTSQFGVSLAELEGIDRAFDRGVAEYLGLTYEDHAEGEWIEFSLSKK